MENTAIDLPLLRQWIDKSEQHHDLIHPGMAAALSAVLDRNQAPAPGEALPPLWHWIYFWSVHPQSEVGPDGHAKRGGFLPPVPLPRRMWAGGRLRFEAPLPVGAQATRTSRIMKVDAKEGRTGSLAFVTVKHEIASNGVVAVTEEHDIVYRDMPAPGSAAATTKAGAPAPQTATWTRLVKPDPVLLFRYSALTFNGHRIHYDRSYVTEVEGYPGLIVHGPLIATMLADLLHRHLPNARLAEFNFRAVGPLFDIEPFEVCGEPSPDGRSVKLWAANLRGELAMQADAILS
ncbi:FAS1-like dehydratase domain-containing protein [Noviherbaspirillum galbum]|uniref:Acyl-CoA dehydrogenase n=1 Tax=Noviherbaspirillum galbum TaxID=2709383 RepID=A0A6B3SPX5_9BURK|nr:MaoC family dehydratase N-terminal domain-containing protein [Noviherbaspirillum galbum]NEX60462.1 acyl-CoA dehydrogenase [Noviherbaspirillum galbum]